MKNANFRNRESHSYSKNYTITQKEYTQIVEAIDAGKYSWACLLILRFAGDNPFLYIPYRTANRLLKENQLANDRDCEAP
ncbi:HetP family heterocyst commitment protein [Oscillatoriales cyanobacterium LEGE 11467]|uniref:HetP family heterocyst commitment protein n=2 Tax=Zarconia TaxID=2992130 RepID=A0A928W069_9CYAN|nr:HetP family heterocyst commitment protein [Zarconia navalis LEGE 11467]